jgi:hypothetical protein
MFIRLICLAGGIVAAVPATSVADVIVLANRTGRELQLRFTPARGRPQQLTLPANDVLPQFLDGKADVTFSTSTGVKHYELDPNCAYFLGRGEDGRVDLQKIGLGEDGATGGTPPRLGQRTRATVATIPVKILVDEEEPGRRANWERRLRRRIEMASAIFEKFCGVKLEVVAVGTWNSDNGTNVFEESLAEFEREVQPSPARLAIGFTSQFAMVRGRTHMAGTRGPLHTHILVREGAPQISEPERLEFLVHELGHYMGAPHSPEPTSVMRPVLGDNLAGRADFKIQFDPVTALVIAMVGEEMRRGQIQHLSDLPPDTKRRLQQIYVELARVLPKDPAGLHYVRLLSATQGSPLVQAARSVLQEITRAAMANRTMPLGTISAREPSAVRRAGDALTEHYVRTAAQAANRLPPEIAPRAMLLALGVAFDDTDSLSKLPSVGQIAQGIEAPSDRLVRLRMLGEPTMGGRRDLAQHFFVSAYITTAAGADAATAAAFAKEVRDADGGSGFNFEDIAADRAGVQFAQSLIEKKLAVNAVARTFTTTAYLPKIKGLPQGLSTAEFRKQFGSVQDERARTVLREIDDRILLLAPYRKPAVKLGP